MGVRFGLRLIDKKQQNRQKLRKIKNLTFMGPCIVSICIIKCMYRKYMYRKYILIYIQQDATLHSLFISGNCPKCFGWYLHPSSGAQTTVSTASGTCQTVTATCRYRGGVGTEFLMVGVETT